MLKTINQALNHRNNDCMLIIMICWLKMNLASLEQSSTLIITIEMISFDQWSTLEDWEHILLKVKIIYYPQNLVKYLISAVLMRVKRKLEHGCGDGVI